MKLLLVALEMGMSGILLTKVGVSEVMQHKQIVRVITLLFTYNFVCSTDYYHNTAAAIMNGI